MLLKRGDNSPDVEQLQLKLKAAGYDPGDIDGDFGPKTAAAVLEFQKDRADLDDDEIVGPRTWGALNAAIARTKPAAQILEAPITFVPCNDTTWAAFTALIEKITKKPVLYGPGRGLWVDGKFVITYNAGSLAKDVPWTKWPNALGKPYPAFHCTSWCNFFISWLNRRNQDYTHAGNIPDVWDLLLKSPDIHQNPGAGPYRGFGDVCFPIAPDGSAVKRYGISKVMDARELYARRASLPTFIMFGQSTRRANKTWNWWHHTGLFVCRDNKLFRIAADGYVSNRKYSATPMKYIEVTPKNVGAFDGVIYRCYGVNTEDGSYGDQTRPIAEVVFE